MRIALHAHTTEIGAQGRGIGVYTKNLFDEMKRLESRKHFTIEIVDTAILTNNELKKRFDIIHYPLFDFFRRTLPSKLILPTVVTVHDTIPLIYPKQYPPGVKGKINFFFQKKALQKVSAVLTDSFVSKKDIVRFLGIKDGRIHPVYLGSILSPVSLSTVEKNIVTKKYNLPNKYVCYVGDVNYNKNLLTLAAACHKRKIHLVIVGKKAASKEYDKHHIENQPLLRLQTEFGDSQYVHRIGFVPDEELPVVMSLASIYCQPSFYEGFGIPPLDAMSLGIPVVCSRTQTLVELYEKAALFADPEDANEFGRLFEELLTDKKLAKELSDKGLVLSKTFSWRKTALETLKIYQSIV